MIEIARVQEELAAAGYAGVADNDPAMYKARSPHTGNPIIIPLNNGHQLPEEAVRHILQGDPGLDDLIARMQP